MNSTELAGKLWDLANAITAFALVQGLVFAYACANKDVGNVLNRKALKAAIAVMIAMIGTAQCVAVEWCRSKLCHIDPAQCPVYSEAGEGRVLCIGSIAIFSILILYARQLFAKKPFDA
jgi:hypothetical protein